MDSLDTPKDDARTMAGLLSGAPGYLMLKGGPQLFSAIAQQVKDRSAASGFAQSAEYKVIKGAGHEVGDFFFVPI